MTTITMLGLGAQAGQQVVLTKINQDSYSGEYFKRVGNTEYRVKVRHLQEKVKAGENPVGRHNVDFTVTTFPIESGSKPIVFQAYFVMRQDLSQPDLAFKDTMFAFAKILANADNANSLSGWDTDLVGVNVGWPT